ncbi:hypothetical protein ACFVSW_00240 [Neobacillus sp. NPDC058068]|uniref:hypothetical protein n=1 Tax=Neobacillus sp. NPDC058068 TaxID=3346325 RepID=UPI0036D786A5
MEKDKKQKQEPNGEIDRFSRFMFGNSKRRETYNEREKNSQESPEQKEQSSFDRRLDRTDNLLFGYRRKEPETRTHTTQNQIEDLINNVDVVLLMETIDMFVETSKQLKPLFKEISPFFHRISKKFLSNEDT